MKVKELIEKLKEFDMNEEVLIPFDPSCQGIVDTLCGLELNKVCEDEEDKGVWLW